MRFASTRYVPAVAILALSGLGCAETSRSVEPNDAAPLLALVGRDSASFVLSRVEQQTEEPFVQVDQACGAVRIQQTVRDTITMWSDGRARAATAMDRLFDGVKVSTSFTVAAGRWMRNTIPNAYYFSEAPSVVLTLEYPRGLTGEIWLRQAGDDAVTRLSPMTTCTPTTGNKGREAEWTYSRR